MESLLVSTGAVAVAEIGDKTQLLALVLAARFRAPLPIIFGILVATLANHALAALLGTAIAELLDGDVVQWGLGLGFVAIGLWTLRPDRLDDPDSDLVRRTSPFLATTIAFFLVEIGDKTQVATMALAARYQDVVMVTLGTTLGMMLANIPVVILGGAFARHLPLKAIRAVAAILFIALGAVICLETAGVV